MDSIEIKIESLRLAISAIPSEKRFPSAILEFAALIEKYLKGEYSAPGISGVKNSVANTTAAQLAAENLTALQNRRNFYPET